MTNAGTTNLEMARTAWGEAAPEWVLVLAQACDAGTQSAVAKRLGVSAAMINTALKKTYAGRMDKLEAKARGELMGQTVACPVLGTITRRRCIDEQSRPYAATNAIRVELRRACPCCPNLMSKEAA